MYYYDDANFSYLTFWDGREYEHESELRALQTLLTHKRFAKATDIGGGYGRLAPFLSRYVQEIVIIEPSYTQRDLSKNKLPANTTIQKGSAESTGLEAESCDLVVMVRVMHHLPNPQEAIAEIHRILKPDGVFVLEFANALNLKSRLRNWRRHQRVPHEPVPVPTTREESDVPFVNHHPQTVLALLRQEGFSIEKTLSVSNLRSPFLKTVVPRGILLALEHLLQRPLAALYFGPSIFVMARRKTHT